MEYPNQRDQPYGQEMLDCLTGGGEVDQGRVSRF